MLRQDIERAHAVQVRILHTGLCRIDRCKGFEHLETVGGNQDCLGDFIEPVICATDALNEAARPLGRTDVDDQIDVAPVDAKVECRSRHDRAQGPAAIAASTFCRRDRSREP